MASLAGWREGKAGFPPGAPDKARTLCQHSAKAMSMEEAEEWGACVGGEGERPPDGEAGSVCGRRKTTRSLARRGVMRKGFCVPTAPRPLCPRAKVPTPAEA